MTFPTRRIWLARAVGCIASVLLACTHVASAKEADPIVFAAASLKNALDEALDVWQHSTGKHAVVSYAASSALAKQIQNGAPADLYISADLDWMDDLQQRDLLKVETRVNLLGNALVLIAAKDNAVKLRIAPKFALAAALGEGRLAVADTTAVPAGRYAKSALEALEVWPDIEAHLAPAENVRAALVLVARGESPLGVVYASDAFDEPKVRVVGTFPAGTHAPIVYPIAQLSKSQNPDSEALRAWLIGKDAREIFLRHGFAAP
ncbi:MAG: molybdate ABC transporter substrate-binding protein [Tahibacter sp.]